MHTCILSNICIFVYICTLSVYMELVSLVFLTILPLTLLLLFTAIILARFNNYSKLETVILSSCGSRSFFCLIVGF